MTALWGCPLSIVRGQYVSLWTDTANWMWVVLSLSGISYGSLCKVHGFYCICPMLEKKLKSSRRFSVVASVAASCKLVSSRKMNKAPKWWNTVFAFLVSRNALSMTCNLATGFWFSTIFDTLSISHFLLTVAPGGMDLDILNFDQRYDLLVERYEEFTKVKVQWNGTVRMS